MLNLKEMLNLADRIVFARTGQHLDDLQEAVLRGTLDRETYQQIAKKLDCSESSTRNKGSELWQILSEELGEEVSKSNLRAAMERFQVSLFSNVVQDHVQVGNISFCSDSRQKGHPTNQNQVNTNPRRRDLTEMPDLGSFKGRHQELETLKNWVLDARNRLIFTTGMSGMGKTALVAELVKQIQEEFETIFWCSLASPLNFHEWQNNLYEVFYREPAENINKTSQILHYCQDHRCLVVIDDSQTLFQEGCLAGQYQTQYKDYKKIFNKIKNLSHQSCFMLVGWEPEQDIPPVAHKKRSIRHLQLLDLDKSAAQDILKGFGLKDTESNSRLIDSYGANPFWLRTIATQIQELGEEIIDIFLAETPVLPKAVQDSLNQQWLRLSKIEQALLKYVARQQSSLTLLQLFENANISTSDAVNTLQSLLRRGWIQKSENEYFLLPTIQDYLLGFEPSEEA